MKRSKLHMAMAMAVALGGVGAGLFTPTASAVNLSQKGIGDVLIFPYYTVRGPDTQRWTTLLGITNTSASVLAVRMRFRESRNSRDVLDFIVLLSPFDQFSGTVVYDATTGARFVPAGWGTATPETTCIVAGNGTGGPIYNSATGPNGLPFKTESYTGSNYDGGPTTSADALDRLREGYVEAIVMGHIDPAVFPGAISAAVTHAPLGAPSGCEAAYNAFRGGIDPATGAPRILATARQFGEPINALKGTYNLINTARGVGAGGSPVALANFVAVSGNDATPAPNRPLCTRMFLEPINNFQSRRNFNWNPAQPGVVAPDVAVHTVTDCPNLIAPQQQPDFNEPSLADAYPSVVFEWSDDDPSGNSTGFATGYLMGPNFGPGGWNAPGPGNLNTRDYGFGFLAVSEALRATALVNGWTNGTTNPLGATTEWVVTHPTKAFFVDANLSTSAAVNPQRFPIQAQAIPGTTISTNYVGEMAIPPFTTIFGGPLAQACTQVGITLLDRDEGASNYDPDISPGTYFDLCYEANVVRFTDSAALANNGDVLGSKSVLNLAPYVAQSATNAKIRPNPLAGWMWMNLAAAASADLTTAPLTASLLGNGLPAIGFAITQRTPPGGAQAAFGTLVDHSYLGRGEITAINTGLVPVNYPVATFVPAGPIPTVTWP